MLLVALAWYGGKILRLISESQTFLRLPSSILSFVSHVDYLRLLLVGQVLEVSLTSGQIVIRELLTLFYLYWRAHTLVLKTSYCSRVIRGWKIILAGAYVEALQSIGRIQSTWVREAGHSPQVRQNSLMRPLCRSSLRPFLIALRSHNYRMRCHVRRVRGARHVNVLAGVLLLGQLRVDHTSRSIWLWNDWKALLFSVQASEWLLLKVSLSYRRIFTGSSVLKKILKLLNIYFSRHLFGCATNFVHLILSYRFS